MYRCLKEDLIYFENCVDFTFLFENSSKAVSACFGGKHKRLGSKRTPWW